jgi:hypothetical protein
MKKIIAFFAIFIAIHATSQEKKFGIMAGASNPTLTEGTLQAVNFQYGLRPHISVFYEMKLNNKIHFRPRLMFASQGSQIANYHYNGYQYADYTLNYLDVPLDFKFWNKIYVIAGPQAGVLISSNVPDSQLKSSVDLGANLALGVRIHKVFLELGIYQGFTPILEGDSMYKYTYHNAAARFSVGWYIL